VVVSSDGGCLWVPPGMFLSTCKIDISWFPFDDQRCTMKFGSWTYDLTGIDLRLNGDQNSGDTSDFISNGEWLLIGRNYRIAYPIVYNSPRESKGVCFTGVGLCVCVCVCVCL